MRKNHTLKIWPEFFEAVKSGRKSFEVRKFDRPFNLGDVLTLEEYDPETKQYSGRFARRIITYMMVGGQFGLDSEYVILGLAVAA